MERKDFLKGGIGFFGMTLLAPKLLSLQTEQEAAVSCVTTNSETAGPFPTITPGALYRSNIVGSRTGVAFTINITVKNVNNSCLEQQGVWVDIWHCDKDGYYSQYGGTQMQTVDYTGEDFLRGRQITDVNGLVSFTSIFPGWYTSRATHIHVHIYDASGNSLLITQIAFPEGSGSAVETVNNATSYGYTQGLNGYTYNANDNVFSDGVTTEMSTITGDLVNGYMLTHEIYISASVTAGIADTEAMAQFQIGQNFPNPFDGSTSIPLLLTRNSDVRVIVTNMLGLKMGEFAFAGLEAGARNIELHTASLNLAAGMYVYQVEVTNKTGVYTQAKVMHKL